MKNVLFKTALALAIGVPQITTAQLQMTKVSTYRTGIFDESASEIVAYDAGSKRLFFTNANDKTIDVLDISTPESPTKVHSITLSAYGKSANSVSSYGGNIAIAVEDTNKQANGRIVIMKASDYSHVATYEIGVLPDMVTFSHDGQMIVAACEGEPNDMYTVDPEGSIAIIDVSAGMASGVTTVLNFNHLDTAKATLKASGVRIFGKNDSASVSQDLEPEYVAISQDNKTAVVTLQENNAIAIVDLVSKQIVEVKALGTIDHSLTGNHYDASDKDGKIDIKAQPTHGFFMPDAISSYTVNGMKYYVTANEGDTRDYDGYSEEKKVADLVLDTVAFPNYMELQNDTNLGRLLTTKANGDTDGDGDVDKIYSIGTRSFSIWDSTGTRVYDSGQAFETKLANDHPTFFNTSNSKNKFDDRSDAKGCEPEALTVAEIDGKFYAFVGLERMGGIMVYDITDPMNPVFDGYELNRDFNAPIDSASAGDLGPEGIIYIKPADLPVPGSASKGMLVVSNEVSGTVTIYALGMYTPLHAPFAGSAEPFQVQGNPVQNGVVYFNVNDVYQVFDLRGVLLKEGRGQSMEISDLTAGMYIVRNSSGHQERIIVQ